MSLEISLKRLASVLRAHPRATLENSTWELVGARGPHTVTSSALPYLLIQVPVPLTDRRRRFLAMKWMITECRDNKPRRTLMPEKLSDELLEAFHNRGAVIKRKHNMHKMAEANRALAHYRWW